MDKNQAISVVFNICFGFLFAPIYGRFVYILLSRQHYRNHECYRIVALIGIVQLLCAPGVAFVALEKCLGYDPWSLCGVTMKLYAGVSKVEPPLSFVLALNRLKVMCGLRYSAGIHKTLIVLILLYGFVFFGFLFTPFADYTFPPNSPMGKYNFSLPLTQVLTQTGFVVNIISLIASFFCYLTVCVYLLWAQWKIGKIKNWKAERSILTYAVVRFLCDMFVIIAYNCIPIREEFWDEMFIAASYSTNMLLLPPVLYLAINEWVERMRIRLRCGFRSIRSEFLACGTAGIGRISGGEGT
ncbi:hypothetical protein L596_019197 [Steinernema carpocapsae]|uniref:G-protein coupled receptors family 1 profile domain-containing protein n=1 Tax=Steinernema carpocapsae TaxID=34508 RepID=A0A4U5MPJ3_STECR|nr:hypothetical protein L596_019197 [Steinernema carpocapsae]